MCKHCNAKWLTVTADSTCETADNAASEIENSHHL